DRATGWPETTGKLRGVAATGCSETDSNGLLRRSTASWCAGSHGNGPAPASVRSRGVLRGWEDPDLRRTGPGGTFLGCQHGQTGGAQAAQASPTAAGGLQGSNPDARRQDTGYLGTANGLSLRNSYRA